MFWHYRGCAILDILDIEGLHKMAHFEMWRKRRLGVDREGGCANLVTSYRDLLAGERTGPPTREVVKERVKARGVKQGSKQVFDVAPGLGILGHSWTRLGVRYDF